MATLVVIRHGEADGNRDHRFIGHHQSHLTDTGLAQATALADRLADAPITRVVSSDLVRCVETVRPLARAHGLEVEVDAGLREVANGKWTGLLPTEIQAGWPDLWADYVSGADVQRPGGETWRAVADRVVPIADLLLGEEGVCVVATHSGPTLVLALWAAGIAQEGNIFLSGFGAPHNSSVTVIAPGPRLVAYNDAGHVAGLPDLRLPFSPVRKP